MNRIMAAVAIGALAAASAARADVYGRHERVRVLASIGIEVEARLEPGRAGSTLRAAEVKYFHRDGDTWVRFVIDNGSVMPGSRLAVERPVLEDSRVRQRDGSTEHRPVVSLPLCVGARRIETRISVTERSGYTEPLTLGSTAMAGLGKVDPAREFTVEPACPAEVTIPAAGTTDGDEVAEPDGDAAGYACDGRRYCSQMGSRAEAQWFLAHCSGMRMDGDGDGEACENDSRW